MKLEGVHIKMLQFPELLCSVHLKNAAKIVVPCALKTAAISGIFLQLPGFLCSVHLSALLLKNAANRIFVLNALKRLQFPEFLCSVHLIMLHVPEFLCSVCSGT